MTGCREKLKQHVRVVKSEVGEMQERHTDVNFFFLLPWTLRTAPVSAVQVRSAHSLLLTPYARGVKL